MKLYTLNILLFFAAITLFSCKKKDDRTGESYSIKVAVADGVAYYSQINSETRTLFRPNSTNTPGSNSSYTFKLGDQYNKNLYIIIETASISKGEHIEVMITNDRTGSVVYSKKEIDKIFTSWLVKK